MIKKITLTVFVIAILLSSYFLIPSHRENINEKKTNRSFQEIKVNGKTDSKQNLTSNNKKSVLITEKSDELNESDKENLTESNSKIKRKVIYVTQAGKKKTLEERALFNEGRLLYEYYRQVNPLTGRISANDKLQETIQSERAELSFNSETSRASGPSFINRGPGNLGGRTRSVVFDLNDATGNTILAGAISGGVFKTINGGASWTKISSQSAQHNVSSIAQDPRAGFHNICYYSTGEGLGNSASLSGALYAGHGIWRSTDSGNTWTQMSFPAANQEFTFDQRFDIITKIAVHPTTGDLFVAALGAIYRFDISAGTWVTEVIAAGGFNTSQLTDVVITSSGRVYAAFSGSGPVASEGIWTSNNATGAAAGTWTRIANDGTPTGWNQTGRAVLSLAPSNQNILYVLYLSDASTPSPGDSDLWRWDQGTTTWTNFSSKIPDEAGGSAGNDPFDSQGAYDLVVSVKPDNANFVVIGGTNAYKINNINTDAFVRIGGYDGPSTYALWNNGGGTNHHPDVHALEFNPFSPNVLFSGTDGGIHKTIDLNAATVGWTNLNNNYQTYQYYHVNIDPLSGSDGVIGGAQDNGTTSGGTSFGEANLTNMSSVFSGDGVAAAISRDNACIPFFMGSQGGRIYRDCPTGATITPTGSVSEFVTYFHLDQSNNNALYYAGQNTLWRTTNSSGVTAGTWTNLGTTALQGDADYFQKFSTTWGAYNSATSYLLLGGDEGHIYRLNDPQNAASFSAAVDITPPGATLSFPSIVTGLAIHPTNRNIVLATYSNYGTQSIFLTTNATAATPTWTLVERNISSLSVRSAAIAEVGGQTIYYVGTTRGLFSTTDPLTTDWTREAPNEIGFALVSSLVYRPADYKLLIGTHGNGMYELTLTLCNGNSTTWNGSSWSSGVPTAGVEANFTGNYNSTGNLSACTVNISNNAQVTFNSGHTLIIGGGLTVDTGSNLIIENNGALRQINKDSNLGSITVKRNSTSMVRLDYTAWSSPVVGQQLQSFSPNTLSNRFYEYLFTGTTTPTAYNSVNATTNFTPGKGYMIRAANTLTGATVHNGQFTGVPSNGDISQSVGLGYNLLGNPYASPISANVFLSKNPNIGTLYFWTNTTPASSGSYPQNNFASYTTLGGTAAFASSKIPNGTIQTGQGFYINATSAGTAYFENKQRVDAATSTQFFRSNIVELNKSRFWINFNDDNTSYNQILIGYMDGSTQNYDNQIDGRPLDTSKSMLYSIIDDEPFVIQGKSNPFMVEDIVPLGFKALNSGNFKIEIDSTDGVFSNQHIYLKDKLSDITHNLSNGAYNFTSEIGTFDNRFEIVYQNETLGIGDNNTNETEIKIYTNQEGITVLASENIREVIVYNVLGSVLYENKNIASKELQIKNILASKQALIIKVLDVNGNSKTSKLIY
ncbi:T9SS sorting signal type C domain-containing protein [Flavobacterium sp.]|uniref:T9SS sorting signal type C domain-containing protein n=1 Tax=Flavobacterium sp. TaxID=239 RepID=UPI0008AB3E42|nr:T9SS sorting signal type C domain-containing protein [Flavobacterium sp.]OGS63066.1 MAG: hypothetical protein A2X07_12215 [Flavobacteria bacterium GWF1_32_7]HBD25825.1 hypothetical protein [Flavobacterium sp.]